MAAADWGILGVEPQISVIVPHYNDIERLGLCLTALMNQSIARERFEVIVADNGSPVGMEAVEAAVAGRARVVAAPTKGAGPARNAGVAHGRGTILAFTDSDCVPEANWLAAGLARLESADIVGGAMTVSVADEASMTGAEAFERVFAFDNRSYVEKKGFTVTANLFCARATFDAVGPFSVGVSEDVDWCHRARGKGFSLAYAADAIVAHPARRDWSELKRKWQRMNAEGYGLVASSMTGRVRWAARSMLMPLSIVVHGPRLMASPVLPNFGARLRGLATLTRLRLWRMADAMGLVLGDR